MHHTRFSARWYSKSTAPCLPQCFQSLHYLFFSIFITCTAQSVGCALLGAQRGATIEIQQWKVHQCRKFYTDGKCTIFTARDGYGVCVAWQISLWLKLFFYSFPTFFYALSISFQNVDANKKAVLHHQSPIAMAMGGNSHKDDQMVSLISCCIYSWCYE